MARTDHPSLFQRISRFVRDDIWGILPTEFSSRTLKLASVLWGGALIAIACFIAHNRSRHGLPLGVLPPALGLAGLIVAALLLIPRVDQAFFIAVMRVMAIVGFFVSSTLMALSFYLVVTPMGWMLRLAGKDPLGLRAAPAWHPHRHDTTRRRYFRMF